MTDPEQEWQSLKVWDRVAELEKGSPDTADKLIAILVAERKHVHRLEWAHWTRQMVGVVLGFGCVLTMAWLAWHYANLGSPLNGAIVMSAGTASIVAIFVTGKYIGRGPK